MHHSVWRLPSKINRPLSPNAYGLFQRTVQTTEVPGEDPFSSYPTSNCHSVLL
uniref:Uncharacterized protein n=1 Tax=Anguilla anguilla TaxID=7936 RepID=A0A0E9Q3F9_ANGAN